MGEIKKEAPKHIYTVMVMEKLEATAYGPEFGPQRIVGWYSNKETALQAVRENCCDIWETCYGYALVEEVAEGLYNPAIDGQRWWFQYNVETGRYDEIDEPEFVGHFCGFTIG